MEILNTLARIAVLTLWSFSALATSIYAIKETGVLVIPVPILPNQEQLQPPHQERLPPPENEVCRAYASRAVSQYWMTTQSQKCSVRKDARWHSDYQSQYKWCLTAPEDWVSGEEKARDDHLYYCGAQKRL